MNIILPEMLGPNQGSRNSDLLIQPEFLQIALILLLMIPHLPTVQIYLSKVSVSCIVIYQDGIGLNSLGVHVLLLYNTGNGNHKGFIFNIDDSNNCLIDTTRTPHMFFFLLKKNRRRTYAKST